MALLQDKKIIGILTKDSKLYFDLLKALKAKTLRFRSLDFDKGIPMDVGVVLTGQGESAS